MRGSILFLVCLLIVFPCQAGTIFVDADANGANNGLSWADAYNFLQDALAYARSDANVSEIRVAQGIYTPDSNSAVPDGTSDRAATFQLINRVIIKGGYAGYGELDPNARDIGKYETILSGDLAGNDVDRGDLPNSFNDPSRAENSYHVVTGSCTDPTAVLNGFTITAGQARDYFNNIVHGTGMLNDEGSPTVMDCTFSRNFALSYGGGMWNNNSNVILIRCTFIANLAYFGYGGGMYNINSSPTLTNCTFTANDSEWQGGGMCNHQSNPRLADCIFANNYVMDKGSGMCNTGSSPTLTDCIFISNLAYWDGGGMCNLDGSSPTLINCTFRTNEAYTGAGMHNSDSSPMLTNCTFSWNYAERSSGGMYNGWSSPTLTNCALTGNLAEDMAGGMRNHDSSLTLTNCKFTGNLAQGHEGGGMYNWGSNVILSNCTLAGNSANQGNALACFSYEQKHPSSLQVTNCILWDGGNEIWNSDGSTITITFSDVDGGWPGEGNIDADPCFVDPGYWDATGVWVEGDYHLLPGSPCIDAGDNNSVPADTTDLDGDGNTTEPIPWDLDGNPRVVDGDNDGNSVVDMGAYEANYVQVEMKFTPQAVNPGSQGRWFKLHFVLPEGFGVEDVDVNKPALCRLMDTDGVAESVDMNIFINEEDLVEVEVAFDRGAFSLCSSGQAERNAGVLGLLAGTGGQYFYGTDSIKIINKTWEHLAGFASHWLEAGCGKPDWCSGFDLNEDSAVNFLDFALFDACCIEIIAE